MIEGRAVAADRIACMVPGCGRTFKHDDSQAEIMCGKHWRMAPKPMRDHYAKLARLYRHRQTAGIAALCNRQWRRIADAVLDVAAGNINPAELEHFLDTI